MKYKHIPSALHNFAHSFVSLTNYVDGEYVVDILGELLRRVPDHRLSISFPSGIVEPDIECPTALQNSIGFYRDWYPKHLASHDVDEGAVVDFRVVIFADVMGMRCRVEARDDRGKRHALPVAV